jgi:tetratricopeptide (TPR) repeat protein
LCLLSACRRPPSAANATPPPPRHPIAETLADAEKYFREREDVEKIRKARATVETVREADHRNYEVEWAYAKYSLFLGEKVKDEQEREKIFEEGRDAGKMASRIDPKRPEGFFWYGANLAELAKMSPVTVGYTSVDDIREAMNNVIQIDPGYQGASAYDILGQIELNTRLFGGKASKAVEYLEKAVQIEKNNSNIRLHLAQAYLDVNKTELAREQLQYILKMEPNPDYIPEHKKNVAEAEKLLKSRF